MISECVNLCEQWKIHPSREKGKSIPGLLRKENITLYPVFVYLGQFVFFFFFIMKVFKYTQKYDNISIYLTSQFL